MRFACERRKLSFTLADVVVADKTILTLRFSFLSFKNY